MKKYIVTGATGGIGKAIVAELCAQGHVVVGVYWRNEGEANQMIADYAGQLRMVTVNLADRAEIVRFADSIMQDDGASIDGIVHCAGVFEQDSFEGSDLEVWDRTLAINATAPLLMTQLLASSLTPAAAVVMVASTDAFVAGYSSYSYAASKAALLSLTKSLAALLGEKGIRVNAVAPGWVDNTGMDAQTSGVLSAAVAKTPLGRNARPSEIAAAVSFLLSGDAFITGETLVVDGGYSIVDPVLRQEHEQSNKH